MQLNERRFEVGRRVQRLRQAVRWGFALGAFVCAAGPSFQARAQTQDAASAAALFEKGLSEMQAGQYETGCPALAESYRLDPLLGVLFTLAECEASWGKVATAMAHYADFLSLYNNLTAEQKNKHAERMQVVLERKAALAPQVPYLTIEPPRPMPPGTVIKRDSLVLGAPSLGIELPVDPGAHLITVEPPNQPPREYPVTLGRGQKLRFVIPPLVPQPTPQPRPITRPKPAPVPDPGVSTRMQWVYSLGGVGLAGLGVGTVTGLLALGKKGTIEDNCTGHVCTAQGKSAADSGQSYALVSTVSFGVGLASLAAATVLYLGAPGTKPTSAPQAAAARRWEPVVVQSSRATLLGVQGVW